MVAPELSFDSLNPYQSLVAIQGDSPEDLVENLRSIKTPIKIIGLTSYGARQVAYVMGDIRIQKQQKSIKREK